jgi:hypothetical protein
MATDELIHSLMGDMDRVLQEMKAAAEGDKAIAAPASAPSTASVRVNRHGSISITGGGSLPPAAASAGPRHPSPRPPPEAAAAEDDASVWAQLAIAQSQLRVLKAEAGKSEQATATMASIKAAEVHSRQAVRDKEVLLSAAEAERATYEEQLRAQRELTRNLEERVARATAEQRQAALGLSTLRRQSVVKQAEQADVLALEVGTREELEAALRRTSEELAQARAEAVAAEGTAAQLPPLRAAEQQQRAQVAAQSVQLRDLAAALNVKAAEADAGGRALRSAREEHETTRAALAELERERARSADELRDAMEAASIFESRMNECDDLATTLQSALVESKEERAIATARSRVLAEAKFEDMASGLESAIAEATARAKAAEVENRALRAAAAERDELQQIAAAQRSELAERAAQTQALEERRAASAEHAAQAMQTAHAAQSAFERAVAAEQRGADALSAAQRRLLGVERDHDAARAQNAEQRELLSQMAEKLAEKDSEAKSLVRKLEKKTAEATSLASALTQLDALSSNKLRAEKDGRSTASAELAQLKQRVTLAERRADESAAALDASEDARRALDHQLQLERINVAQGGGGEQAAAPRSGSDARSKSQAQAATLSARAATNAATPGQRVRGSVLSPAPRTPVARGGGAAAAARSRLVDSPFASPSAELLKAQQALRRVTEQLQEANAPR